MNYSMWFKLSFINCDATIYRQPRKLFMTSEVRENNNILNFYHSVAAFALVSHKLFNFNTSKVILCPICDYSAKTFSNEIWSCLTWYFNQNIERNNEFINELINIEVNFIIFIFNDLVDFYLVKVTLLKSIL